MFRAWQKQKQKTINYTKLINLYNIFRARKTRKIQDFYSIYIQNILELGKTRDNILLWLYPIKYF